jgi:hypothetical protein
MATTICFKCLRAMIQVKRTVEVNRHKGHWDGVVFIREKEWIERVPVTAYECRKCGNTVLYTLLSVKGVE